MAHALVRAVFALLRTQSEIRKNLVHGVHTSVNAARVGACATSALQQHAKANRVKC